MADYISEFKGKEIDARLEKMVNVTYEELVALRDDSKLIPGQKYRMIDYETMTSQEGTQSAGHPFDLILTALDEKTLDEKCSAIQSERDTDGYFENYNLTAWDVRYCLDNKAWLYGWIPCSYYEAYGVKFWPKNIKEVFFMNLNKKVQIQECYYAYNMALDEESQISAVAIMKIDGVIYAGSIVYVKKAIDGMPEGVSVGDWAFMSDDLGEYEYIEEAKAKGVIYSLEDERKNRAPFDFYNIQVFDKVTGEGYRYIYAAKSVKGGYNFFSREYTNNSLIVSPFTDSTSLTYYIPLVSLMQPNAMTIYVHYNFEHISDTYYSSHVSKVGFVSNDEFKVLSMSDVYNAIQANVSAS